MFSGIGGFELGIQRAFNDNQRKVSTEQADGGINSNNKFNDVYESTPSCIGYSEIDKYAIKVYERQFNGHTNYGDATKINPAELPDFDLLVGGFPCQAFSIAGKRNGFNDTRGTLFFDIARILAEKRPRHLVLENVKGLLSHDSGKTFQTILGVLSDLGYRVEWQILNSKDFGVPQNRERVYIVGHLGNVCGQKVFPIRQSNKAPAEYSRQEPGLFSGAVDSNYYKGHDGKRTLIAEPRIRRLTPLECERLQGFPDNWTAGESDTQRYKMCGNAVTVNVVEAVMERLFNETV
jgi:DNA-cytosine methyltransferase